MFIAIHYFNTVTYFHYIIHDWLLIFVFLHISDFLRISEILTGRYLPTQFRSLFPPRHFFLFDHIVTHGSKPRTLFHFRIWWNGYISQPNLYQNDHAVFTIMAHITRIPKYIIGPPKNRISYLINRAWSMASWCRF